MTGPTPPTEVKCHRHDGWAELVLNRPERRNAIDGLLADGLLAHLTALRADEGVRAIVLRGEGGALCSGLDLKAFNAEPAPEWLPRFAETWHAVHLALLQCPQVLVVALERFAINGGAALAIAGDLLVVGQGAYLQVAEVQIGMAAPKNLAWLALRHGEALAARLALLGDRWDAEQLLRQGIASEVVADDQVAERARAIAQRIAGFPPQGPLRIKSGLRAASLRMAAGEWFDAVARNDPLAGASNTPPKVNRPR
jgi:enoyl-CoA hydratase/carnithine racemase